MAPVTSLSAVVVLTAVLVFAVSHSVFFWFITGREIERIILRKAQLLALLRRALVEGGRPDDALRLDAYLTQCAASAARIGVPNEADEREARNVAHMGKWVGPLLALFTVTLVGCIAHNVRAKKHLTYAQWIGILLALFSYLPELIVHYTGSDHYAFVPDSEVVSIGLGIGLPASPPTAEGRPAA